MVSGTQRKCYMLGGKGGVGKTSCVASLAVKFANNGHHTLVVSTDPAHSLSDSFARDLTGGTLVPVEGPDFPLFALELRELKLGELLDTPPPGLDEAIAISKVMQFLESPQYNMFTRIVFDTAPTVRTYIVTFVIAGLHGCINRRDIEASHSYLLITLLEITQCLNQIAKTMRKNDQKLRQKIASAISAIKYVFGQEETHQNAAGKLK
ncbi:hypothetical protein CRYUN_Cryun01aG0062200 [Craigia yunnanensis]